MSKHPTREILESGGIVEGEAFELMLKRGITKVKLLRN